MNNNKTVFFAIGALLIVLGVFMVVPLPKTPIKTLSKNLAYNLGGVLGLLKVLAFILDL